MGVIGGRLGYRLSRLLAESGYAVEHFEAVPIRNLRLLAAAPTHGFLTVIIRCRLSAV
jgi:hypothetical protein